MAKLLNILLIAAISLSNCSISFADQFAVIASETFNASVTIPDTGDTDFDGMDNAWESQYGLDPNNPEDAYVDNDDDDFTNLEEYRMGTNPLTSESSIAVYITKDPAGGIQPLDVTFTANVTNDGGNDIVKYEWDFDGNGTYDYTSTDNSVLYKFTASGQQNIKLRVTNAAGFIKVARETINVTKATDAPTATVGINAIDSTIPVAVAYSGFGTDPDLIASYEWELTGDGESDFKSTRSASVTYTYRETRSKSFYPYLKVTNAKGLSDIALLGLGVNLNAGNWYAEPDNAYRPKVVIESGYVVRDKKAGEAVSFSGYGIPVGGNSFGYAKKLEWDFESDGIYDWVTEINSPNWNSGRADVTHVYGTPGVYRATLKVTTEANLTATDHVLVIVEEGAGNPPRATAKVNYAGNNNVTSITGTVPLVAEFIHRNSSGGNIAKYEWDFDGDKRFDYSTAENNPQTDKPLYVYMVPGYYLACLRVTDVNGLTDTDYIPVFVTMPATYASVITVPGENSAVAGNSVTLICNVFPDNAGVSSVMFQYSADSGVTWNNIGLGEQVSSYLVAWDTTALTDGDYLIRAIINNVDSASFIPSTIEIKNNDVSNADIYENTEAGKHTKKEKINLGQSNEISLPGGATIEMPIGSVPQGTVGNVYIEVIDDSVATGGTIEINLIGAAALASDIVLSLPYPDENQDGIVDGTNISENTLTVNWFNEDTDKWEAIYDSVVYPEENIVSARINHLSLFGWGGGGIISIITGGGASSTDGGVSYCFIATACYGSADAKEVMILRQFRDAFLMKDNLGKKFVTCYYKYSPPVAKYIENKQTLKKIVKLALRPIVKFAQWKLKGRK